MDGQLSKEVKSRRSTELIAIQNGIREEILSAEVQAKSEHCVLFETHSNGFAVGHTSSFIEVAVKSPIPLHSEIKKVRLTSLDRNAKNLRAIGEIIETEV
jgi:tRNA A37 methylthiotransferase MiaB